MGGGLRRKVLLLSGQAILLGLMMAFLVVPASTLFLHTFGAARLGWVYLSVAAVGVVVSWSLSVMQRRWSLSRLALTMLAAYATVVAVGWVLLTETDFTAASGGLLVLFPLTIPLGFMIIGAQAGRLLDVRELKGHFPKVAAGFSVGFAIGGLAAAGLVDPLGGSVDLLLVDVVVALGFVAMVAVTTHRYAAVLRSAPEPPPPQESTGGAGRSRGAALASALRNRLVLLVFGYQFISAAVTQLLDYMVWERSAARYPDPDDLARFLGLFGAVINVTSIVIVFGAAGWLLSRFGIRFGLAANPVGVLLLLAVGLATGWGAGVAGLAFFLVVCAQQVVDISLTDGTTRASINATYQALPPRERLIAQTRIEAAGVPLALGFVGAVLLVWPRLGLGILELLVLTFVITVAWAALAILAYREYGRDLRRGLGTREWDPVALRVDDPASLQVLQRLLESPDHLDVRLALDVIAQARPQDLEACLAPLLDSPDPRIQEQALQVLASTPSAATGTNATSGAANRSTGRLGNSVPNGGSSRDPSGVPSAVPNAASNGAGPGHPTAHEAVLRLLHEPDTPAGVRTLAARVATEWPESEHDLLALEESHDPELHAGGVVALVHRMTGADGSAGSTPSTGTGHPEALDLFREALVGAGPRRDAMLAAAAEDPHAALAPAVLEVAQRGPVDGIHEALLAHAAWLLPAAERVLLAGRPPSQGDLVLLRALGASPDPGCRTLLVEHLSHASRTVADAVRSGLVLSGEPLPQGARPLLEAELVRESERAALAKTALDILQTSAGGQLAQALTDDIQRGRDVVVELLGLLPQGPALRRVAERLSDEDSAARAIATETLEVSIGRGLTLRLVELFGPATTGPPVGTVSAHDDSPAGRAVRDCVRDLVLDRDRHWDEPWLRACALRAAADVCPDAQALAEPFADDADSVVAETAQWVLTHTSAA